MRSNTFTLRSWNSKVKQTRSCSEPSICSYWLHLSYDTEHAYSSLMQLSLLTPKLKNKYIPLFALINPPMNSWNVFIQYGSTIFSMRPERQNYEHKTVNIFLSIGFDICFGCSKEPSHWDGSFEHPEHMLWFRNMKNNFDLNTHSYQKVCALYLVIIAYAVTRQLNETTKWNWKYWIINK